MLIWMSWGMIAGAATAVVPGRIGGLPGGLPGLGGPAIVGIVATLGNPYWFLWWVSVGAAQLAWTRSEARTTPLAFWAGHVTSDLVWLSVLAMAVASGRRFLSDALYRGLLYALGLAIGLLGLYFVLSARSIYRGQALGSTGRRGNAGGASPPEGRRNPVS
jgi:threonine/homoserine/homoserine lactone efflux protein